MPVILLYVVYWVHLFSVPLSLIFCLLLEQLKFCVWIHLYFYWIISYNFIFHILVVSTGYIMCIFNLPLTTFKWYY